MTLIAAVGDIHLGRPKPRCQPNVVTAYLDDVATDARAAGAQALVIPGDFCDRRAGEAEKKVAVAAVEKLAKVLPVVMVWGNHDAACGLSEVTAIDGVHLAGASPEVFHFDGFDIAAVSVVKDRDDRLVACDFPAPQRPTLGVVHSGLEEPYGSVCLPVSVDKLARRGYAGWALGHIHERLEMNAQPPIWYTGTHWKKKAEPGYLLFDVAAQSVDVRLIELNEED